MKKSTALICVLLATGFQTGSAKTALSLECEQALALSALPERLRSQASVYTWSDGRFEKTISSDGPFSCIVERNHPEAIIPQCVDAAGTQSILPALMFRTEQALSGKAPDEVRQMFNTKAESGEFRAPGRPGLSYMMSEFNRVYIQQSDQMVYPHAHLMFYAPNLSNDDIGGSFQAALKENRGVPFIIEEGIHGYMVSFVDHPSDSSQVKSSCDGEIKLTETKDAP